MKKKAAEDLFVTRCRGGTDSTNRTTILQFQHRPISKPEQRKMDESPVYHLDRDELRRLASILIAAIREQETNPSASDTPLH